MTKQKFFIKNDDDEFIETEAFAQADVDDIIAKRLERERSKYSDYEDIKSKAQKVDELQSEYEDKLSAISNEKTELEQKLQKTALEVDKVKVINEFKLSDDLAEFLEGNNVDEIRKKAEKLSRGVTGGVKVDKQEKPDPNQSDSKKTAKALFGSSSD